jgi:hypothetical protein
MRDRYRICGDCSNGFHDHGDGGCGNDAFSGEMCECDVKPSKAAPGALPADELLCDNCRTPRGDHRAVTLQCPTGELAGLLDLPVYSYQVFAATRRLV